MPEPRRFPNHSRRRWQSKGQRQRAFIAALSQTSSVIHAAAIVDVDRTTPYTWRDRIPGFAALWDEALANPSPRRRGLFDLPISRMNMRLLMYADRKLQALVLRADRGTDKGRTFDSSTGCDSADDEKMFHINGPALRPPERQ